MIGINLTAIRSRHNHCLPGHFPLAAALSRGQTHVDADKQEERRPEGDQSEEDAGQKWLPAIQDP